MPTDNRRNQGPESSTPYLLYANQKETLHDFRERLLKDGVRKDGRKWNEHRRLYMKTSVVTQAKGSAYVELGKTKIICSVFDPREIPRKSEFSVTGELYCEFKYAPFSCVTRRGHQSDTEERDGSVILKRALEPAVCRHEFPNFQVDVYVLVLENDGSALSTAITCAGLALADASIPMYDLVVGTTLGIHDDLKFLDPTVEETELCNIPPKRKNANQGTIVFAYQASHQQISEFALTGVMDISCTLDTIDLLTAACEDIYPLSQQCLVKSIKKTLRRKRMEENCNKVDSNIGSEVCVS